MQSWVRIHLTGSPKHFCINNSANRKELSSRSLIQWTVRGDVTIEALKASRPCRAVNQIINLSVR